MVLEELLDTTRVVAEISSNVFGRRRFKLLKAFAEGKVSLAVVAREPGPQIHVAISAGSLGRGVDVPDIDCVINYDLPSDAHTYVHRAGRTARAGRQGLVLSLVTKQEVGRTPPLSPAQRLKLKAQLLSVGVWEAEAENRRKDADYLEQHTQLYQKALDKLKTRLEAH